MVQQPTIPHAIPADFDHHFALFPTRSDPHVASYVPAAPAARLAGSLAAGPLARFRAHTIRGVAVLEVAGRLGDVVEDLDLAIQLALSEGPRGVVCDLSGRSDLSDGLEGADLVAVEVLATAGRHVRDWPGIPIAVACPDPRVREALRAHPLGAHLIVTVSPFSAITGVLATPTIDVLWLRLAPHPTAPRAAREFVTATLLDQGLSPVAPFASLVVSELVASSSVNAGTEIDLSVAWDKGALRLTVRDHGPALPGQRPSVDLRGRGLTVVAGLSRTFGVLPTADGGKVIWAVFEAPRPPPRTKPHRCATARQESLIRIDAFARSSNA